MRKVIKSSLACGLLAATAGFPTVAQALVPAGGQGGSAIAATLPSAPQQLASSESSFQWGDAGIGAAGATVLLGAGGLGVAVTRRRRVQRTVVG